MPKQREFDTVGALIGATFGQMQVKKRHMKCFSPFVLVFYALPISWNANSSKVFCLCNFVLLFLQSGRQLLLNNCKSSSILRRAALRHRKNKTYMYMYIYKLQ